MPPAVFFDDEFIHEGYDRFRLRPRPEAHAGPRPQPPPGWKAVLAIVWLLYLVSLVYPACRIRDFDFGGHIALPGAYVLVIGWFPPVFVPLSANFLLVAGWQYYLQGRGDRAWWFGLSAVVAACTTFALCHCEPVEQLLPGFYLWLTSLFAFAAAAYRLQQTQRARPLSPLPTGAES